MASTTYSGWDHKGWARAGLKDFGDFAECVEYCNQQDDYCDSSRGDWYWGDEEGPTEYDQPTWVIYWGTFGNDHSPGSSHTYAEVFDDFGEYQEALARWERCPEYLESEEDEEDEDGDEGEHEEVGGYGGES